MGIDASEADVDGSGWLVPGAEDVADGAVGARILSLSIENQRFIGSFGWVKSGKRAQRV